MKKTLIWIMAAILLFGCATVYAEDANSLTEVRCDEWQFSVGVPSGMTAVPYNYINPDEDPEDAKKLGGGLAISADGKECLPQVWILRRDHVFNNPGYYLVDQYSSYLYEQEQYGYEEDWRDWYHFGDITLDGAGCRYLDDQDQELFRELRLIPYGDDKGTEFVVRYTKEEEKAAFDLLDTVIRNYAPDEEKEQAQAMHRPLQKEPDLQNGTFQIRLEDMDKIKTEGWFTAALYTKDRYAAEDVQSMKAGDTVQINDCVHTLTDVEPWENDDGSWYEANISTAETAPEQSLYGFCFEKDGDGFRLYIMDDWYSQSRVASVRIDIAKAHPIAYYTVPGGEDPELLYENLLSLLKEEEDWSYSLAHMNRYNTTCTFQDGELVRIDSGSYPYGPIDPFIPLTTEENQDTEAH